jgi:hypothetical protein
MWLSTATAVRAALGEAFVFPMVRVLKEKWLQHFGV